MSPVEDRTLARRLHMACLPRVVGTLRPVWARCRWPSSVLCMEFKKKTRTLETRERLYYWECYDIDSATIV